MEIDGSAIDQEPLGHSHTAVRTGLGPVGVVVIGVICLVAGFGGGYIAHGGGTTKPTAAAAVFPSSAASITVHGSLTLKRGAFEFANDTSTTCVALPDYSDISAGTAVTIGDQSGATIAVGRLQEGQLKRDPATGSATGCSFGFDVPAPGDRTSYSVTISHRGTQVFSPIQTQEADMTLG